MNLTGTKTLLGVSEEVGVTYLSADVYWPTTRKWRNSWVNCGEKSPDSGVQHLRRLTLLVQGSRSQVLVAHCPDLDVALERQRLQ